MFSFSAVDARYDVAYFWLFVEFMVLEVVGATSSEGFLV